MTTNQQLDKLCMEHFGNRKYVADGIFHESAEYYVMEYSITF